MAARKKSRIVLPEDAQPSHQLILFPDTRRFDPLPRVDNSAETLRKILYERSGPIGLDLEYHEYAKGKFKPSILGLASDDICGAIRYDDAVAKEVIEVTQRSNRLLVGHAVVGADRPVLNEATGIITPLNAWGDSMITHYLCNQDFAKTIYKEEDQGDSGSLGFMNLWTAASMTTDLPQWKYCRGKSCAGAICPTHDVYGYCAIDAWAGLQIYKANLIELSEFDVGLDVVDDMMRDALICHEMEAQGVAVDFDRIKQLNAEMRKHKDAIFEFEMVGGEKVFKYFNPNAPEQVRKWFNENGIALEKNDIKAVIKEMEKVAAKYDLAAIDDLITSPFEFPLAIEQLIKLYDYKRSGKGTDPWFGPKYIHPDNLIHPRFISTGASSTRLASSKPNFQNIGNKGWAKKLKTVVIPRSKDLDLIESDSSQLELRACLWQAGVPTTIANTIFEQLVAESGGKYARAAELAKWEERTIAKTVVHASNYLEGIQIYSEADLARPNIKKEIENGAITLHPDWIYAGGIVGFNGTNLADRLFGSHTYENRQSALALRKQYVEKVPELRKWQQKQLALIEKRGFVQLPTKHFLRLNGSARENAKIGIATLGQGTGAQYIRGVMRQFEAVYGRIPLLQVHDSLVFEVCKDMSDKDAYNFISLMYEEVPKMPGFKAPGKATRGPNYGDRRPLNG